MPAANDFVAMIGYTMRTRLSLVNVLTLSSETRMQTVRIPVV